MNFRCPVCFFDQMPYPPEDYHICPCCGTEFGNDDVEFGYDVLRNTWIDGGAHWFFGQPPAHWNAWVQLAGMSFGTLTTTVSAPNTADIWGEGILEYSMA
jgi:hypothetical protein